MQSFIDKKSQQMKKIRNNNNIKSCVMLWIFIQDNLFSSQGELLSMRVLRMSRVHNIRSLDNHLSGLSISFASLALSWVYRLPFFKSLVWFGCDSNWQPSVLVANALPLHYQSVRVTCSYLAKIRAFFWYAEESLLVGASEQPGMLYKITNLVKIK